MEDLFQALADFHPQKMAQASRLVTMDYDSITMEDVKTIVASDIEMPVTKIEKPRFGFCA